MAELVFEASADAALSELERDKGRKDLLGRVDAALEFLESNPGDARCRRLSYMSFGWGTPVRTRNDDWLILWRIGPAEEVIVRYIGPDLR